MSITVRKTPKGLTICTTGMEAERLLRHLADERLRTAADAPAQAGGKGASAVVTTINVRVRTKTRRA